MHSRFFLFPSRRTIIRGMKGSRPAGTGSVTETGPDSTNFHAAQQVVLHGAGHGRELDLAAKFSQLEPGGKKIIQFHETSHGSGHRERGRDCTIYYYRVHLLLCSVLYQRISSSTGFGVPTTRNIYACQQMSGLKYVLISLAAAYSAVQ
jgi:hypothetical protein